MLHKVRITYRGVTVEYEEIPTEEIVVRLIALHTSALDTYENHVNYGRKDVSNFEEAEIQVLGEYGTVFLEGTVDTFFDIIEKFEDIGDTTKPFKADEVIAYKVNSAVISHYDPSSEDLVTVDMIMNSSWYRDAQSASSRLFEESKDDDARDDDDYEDDYEDDDGYHVTE